MEQFPRQAERDKMVEMQIAARGVTHPKVLTALRTVPRHVFVPPEEEPYAYEDHPVRIGCGQTISQPYMVAIMTELLELKSTDRVLEIGTGSGYQTAVLTELAGEVISVERHAALAEAAQQRLNALGCTNVTVVCGDGSLGYFERAPYDAILVTAGSPAIPPPLKEQLAEDGRLICPAGGRDVQRLMKVIRTGATYLERESISCIFVPLIGEDGWPAQ